MTQGRLPREENPPAGQRPGFVGSFKKQDGTYVPIEEGANHLPVEDPDVKAEIEALKAEVTAIKNGTTDVSDSEAQTRLQAIEDKLNAVLSVSDSDAKTELEELKQKNQEILDKLNGTLETSVTGSNVAVTRKLITSGLELQPGEMKIVDSGETEYLNTVRYGLNGTNSDVSGVEVYFGTGRHSSDVNSSTRAYQYQIKMTNEGTERNQYSKDYILNGAHYAIILKNTTDQVRNPVSLALTFGQSTPASSDVSFPDFPEPSPYLMTKDEEQNDLPIIGIKDNDGNGVLPVVNRAPHAYDAEKGLFMVRKEPIREITRSVEIRDTGTKVIDFEFKDVIGGDKDAGKILYFIHNTHSETANIDVRFDLGDNGGMRVTAYDKSEDAWLHEVNDESYRFAEIPGGSSSNWYFLNTYMPILDLPGMQARFRVSCDSAPESGIFKIAALVLP